MRARAGDEVEGGSGDRPLHELARTFREARQRRGWSIDQVAEKTRITQGNLAALEAGDISRIPAAVYIRGFVRTYARALELDEEELLRHLDAVGVLSATVPAGSGRPSSAGPVEQAGEGGNPPPPAAVADEDERAAVRRAAGAAALGDRRGGSAAGAESEGPPVRLVALAAIVVIGGVAGGLGVRALYRWMAAPSGDPVPTSPFQQTGQAHAGGAAPEGKVVAAARTGGPEAATIRTAVAVTVTATADCEIQFRTDGDSAEHWRTLKAGENAVFRAKERLVLLVSPAGAVQAAGPTGSVKLPRNAGPAAYVQFTAAGMEKLVYRPEGGASTTP